MYVEVIASILSPFLADKISSKLGNKFTIVVAGILYSASAISISVVKDTHVAFGIWTAWYIVMGHNMVTNHADEIYPLGDWTKTVLPDTCFKIGSIFASVLSDIHLGSSVVKAIAAAPPIAIILLTSTLSESPKWLVMKHRVDDAIAVLMKTSLNQEEAETRLKKIFEDYPDAVPQPTSNPTDGAPSQTPLVDGPLQNDEDEKCKRALALAKIAYTSIFDYCDLVNEDALQVMHDEAAKRSMDKFNGNAMGNDTKRREYKNKLMMFFDQSFMNLKISFEASSDAIEDMKTKLREACGSTDKNIDDVMEDYESLSPGPGKLKKLTAFLRESLEDPLVNFFKKKIADIGDEKNSLKLHCGSLEVKVSSLEQKLSESDKLKANAETELIKKQEEIQGKDEELEKAKQMLTTLHLDVENANSKIESPKIEISSLKDVIEEAESKRERSETEILSLKAEIEKLSAKLEAKNKSQVLCVVRSHYHELTLLVFSILYFWLSLNVFR